MMGKTTGIEKSGKCTAAISTAYTIGKFGADDDTFSLATANTDLLTGVFQHTTTTAGEEVRLMLSGITPVVLGGTVTRGQKLTSDSTGKAIAIETGAVAVSVIGIAFASGVSGDIIPMFLAQSFA